MWDPAFRLIKILPINHCPVSRSFYIPLKGILTLKRINQTSQFGIIIKLANGASNSYIQLIDKHIQQNWPWKWTLRNTTSDNSPARCSPILYNTFSSTLQPVLYLAHWEPAHTTDGKHVQKDAVRDSIKSIKSFVKIIRFIYFKDGINASWRQLKKNSEIVHILFWLRGIINTVFVYISKDSCSFTRKLFLPFLESKVYWGILKKKKQPASQTNKTQTF